MQKTLLVAVVTAIVFAVGGWLVGSIKEPKPVVAKHAHKAQDCKGKGSCKITINVGSCDPQKPDPSTCDVYAVEEVTLIGADNKQINFEIATNGFRFDQTDGIKFDSLNSGNQYFQCAPQGDHYNCDVSAPDVTIYYKYLIHIQKLDPVDPWVIPH